MEGQLFQDVVDVPFDRVGGEMEALRNLLVAQPVRNEVEDRPLSLGHADGPEHFGRLPADCAAAQVLYISLGVELVPVSNGLL